MGLVNIKHIHVNNLKSIINIKTILYLKIYINNHMYNVNYFYYGIFNILLQLFFYIFITFFIIINKMLIKKLFCINYGKFFK